MDPTVMDDVDEITLKRRSQVDDMSMTEPGSAPTHPAPSPRSLQASSPPLSPHGADRPGATLRLSPTIIITRRKSSWLDPEAFTLDTTPHRSFDIVAQAPDANLPLPILTPTNVHEREIYAKELVHRLVNNKTTVELSWRPRCLPRSGQPFTELLCVFVDKRGSLSAITSTLASLKINILGLSAFSTDTGIAIDTFEVDRFDESAAMSLIASMEALDASRQASSTTVNPGGDGDAPLSSHLPPAYITSTNAQEREIHAQLFQRLVQHRSSVELSWHPLHDRPGVALSCAFVDKRGSLSAITNTLASHGINILKGMPRELDRGCMLHQPLEELGVCNTLLRGGRRDVRRGKM